MINGDSSFQNDGYLKINILIYMYSLWHVNPLCCVILVIGNSRLDPAAQQARVSGHLAQPKRC